MTSRKPIQIPSNFVICEDGTMWERVKSSGGLMSPFIPTHWIKVDDIPSEEEHEKQCKEREELWKNYIDKKQKVE